MNKTDAAAFLGVSVRTLEDYTTRGRITCNYVKGKTRPVADYDADDLEKLKAELAAPVARANVIPQNRAGESAESRSNTGGESRETALARFREIRDESGAPVVVISPNDLSELARVLIETTQNQTSQNTAEPDLAELAVKKMLTLDEAAALAGASKGQLRTAIAEGSLIARTIGRGWKIRPADLNSWVDGLFDGKPAESNSVKPTSSIKPTSAKGSK